MARRCELTGKDVMTGHLVSHANNKRKRVFRPNLQQITLASEALGTNVRLKVAMSTLRTLDRRGGLDEFLLKAKDEQLSTRALRLKRQIRKATEKREAKAA
jgi:large subunit ribosomal protein L28